MHYDPAAIVGRKTAAGEAFDVAIAGDKALEKLVEQGIVLAGSTAIFGVNGASLAYRRGAAKPDIATPDALKAVILNAKTISFSDPAGGGSSSNYFAGIIQQLGLTDEVQRKAILTEPGKGAFPVGEGKAEIGVAQTSEIAMAPGVGGGGRFFPPIRTANRPMPPACPPSRARRRPREISSNSCSRRMPWRSASRRDLRAIEQRLFPHQRSCSAKRTPKAQ